MNKPDGKNRLFVGGLMCLLLVIILSAAIYLGSSEKKEEIEGPEGPLVEFSGMGLNAPSSDCRRSKSGYPLLTHQGEVAKNTNFFDLMIFYGLSPQVIHEMVKATGEIYDLKRIYPGQKYRIYSDENGEKTIFRFEISDEEYIEISTAEDTVTALREEYPYRTHRKTASGIISNSLFESIQTNHIPFELAVKLNDIFAWDIDFFTDLRPNDYYRLIYEEKEIAKPDGEIINKIDRIVAAEFNCDGDKHYAFLFKNDGENFEDYFDEKGNSLRKQLLRAPLSFTRISSGFSYRRFHPVLHHYRPHLGIDYAAPRGTPVMSTGDGTVIKASYTRANGNYVKIRHNSNYISYYLHLSRFGKGIKYGAKVTQGDIIGYVGATGYATGPHLDYRIKKNGQFVNPRKLKLPPAEPVADSSLADFTYIKNRLLSSLNRIEVGGGVVKYYTEKERKPGADKAGQDDLPAAQTQSSSSR